MEERHENDRQKRRYFKEFFVGLVPHNKLAQLYNLIFIWRRIFIVLVALQLGNVPMIQLGLFTLLCMINLIYLVHARLYKNRWAYQLEVFNDISVYMTGIHGLAFTASVTNFDAYDALGYSLGGVVILNLLFNMSFLIFDSCVSFRTNLAVKFTKAQKQSRSWDATVNFHFTCNCACVTCGAIDTKTSIIISGDGKKMRAFPAHIRPDVIVFSLELTPCEVTQTLSSHVISDIESNQAADDDDDEDDRIVISSKFERRVNRKR